MEAVVGDRLHVRGNVVGHRDRTGVIVEVRDASGAPPYLVEFDDGHTCLVFPGPGARRRAPGAQGKGRTKAAEGEGLTTWRRVPYENRDHPGAHRALRLRLRHNPAVRGLRPCGVRRGRRPAARVRAARHGGRRGHRAGCGQRPGPAGHARPPAAADGHWQHAHGSRGHGRSHVLPAFVAPFTVLPVVSSRLALGTWQSVAIVDLNVDNPDRQVRLSLVG